MHFVTKKLHRDRHSTNPLLSTQCHGHDPEAADLAVYLAITVSTFIFLHIYTYIYIFIFIWIIFSQNNLHFYLLYSCRLLCNVSKTLYRSVCVTPSLSIPLFPAPFGD